jgi:hypothetical protein
VSLSAGRLRLLEFGALLQVEADPPPYLEATIGPPFPAGQRVGRRLWLRAAWSIEQLRADRGISDPDIALGSLPTRAGVRHLYDLADKTLADISRDLGWPRIPGGPALFRARRSSCSTSPMCAFPTRHGHEDGCSSR